MKTVATVGKSQFIIIKKCRGKKISKELWTKIVLLASPSKLTFLPQRPVRQLTCQTVNCQKTAVLRVKKL